MSVVAIACCQFVLTVQENVLPDAPPRPNIIIILADDMGYGDASCYGNKRYQTPYIDRLAVDGMRFTDFHSSGTVCSPTRAGLLTGRYQQRAGVPGVIYADSKQNRHHGLHAHEVTFANLLRDAGYSTASFGKWHLGYRRMFNPVRHGFQRFRGYVSGNVDYISHVDRMGIADWWDGEKLVREDGYTTRLITKYAIRFIEQCQGQPFCLYIAHECPHSPYQGPHDKPVRAAGRGAIKGAARQDVKQAYREMMIEMDKGIGEVIATVKRLGLSKNTFLFFFSDNGANRNGSNGSLRGFKGSVWEGGHRVPAIAWWPGHIKPGTVCEDPAISIDIMPTILKLTGAKLPKGHKLDGVSLVPAMTGQRSLSQRTLFWDYRGRSAVRRGPWKLVLKQSGPNSVGLFKLDDDLAERDNLATKNPDRVKQLSAALAAWKRDVAKGATVQPAKKN